MHPNDPTLKSFVPVEPDSDFPVQNLPYGVFSTSDEPARRVGVAIGDFVLDLSKLEQEGALDLGGASVFDRPSINEFMSLGPEVWSAARSRISHLLRHDNPELRDNTFLRKRSLVTRRRARMHLPLVVSGFTDFYSSKEHATNVGIMLRGKDNALQPNWLYMPIGYNGRASTVVVSGTPIFRPWGQIKDPAATAPSFGPCKRLDFELEMGAVVGQPSKMGRRLGEEEAEEMIFGFVLLNDWSARDMQAWEYVPLGPFQAKAFASIRSAFTATNHFWQLHDDLDREPCDLTIDKTRFSAFIPDTCRLHDDLKASGVDTIVISGTLTNCCCESTARDAMQMNYRVILVSDANAALSDTVHNARLDNMAALFADVRSTDEVVELMGKCASELRE